MDKIIYDRHIPAINYYITGTSLPFQEIRTKMYILLLIAM